MSVTPVTLLCAGNNKDVVWLTIGVLFECLLDTSVMISNHNGIEGNCGADFHWAASLLSRRQE